MTPTFYPLTWPAGWPRTPRNNRVNGKSRWSHSGKPWTFDAARVGLADELDKLGATGIVLSTNYELRLDGAPRAGAPTPTDVGIAVYFTYKGRQVAMARDAFDRAEENIRSLTLAIKAMRAIEEHGGSLMMERAFEGFTAIPHLSSKRSWREVMDMTLHERHELTAEAINNRFRALAKNIQTQIQQGLKTESDMQALNVARDEALKEISQ